MLKQIVEHIKMILNKLGEMEKKAESTSAAQGMFLGGDPSRTFPSP